MGSDHMSANDIVINDKHKGNPVFYTMTHKSDKVVQLVFIVKEGAK